MASASYDRRNARARALGYSSYYDYRAHGSGRLPPSAPRLSGQKLSQARGHAGRADLLRSIRPGTLVTSSPDLTSRRKDGTFSRLYVTTIDEDGKEREFLLRTPQRRAGRSSWLDSFVDDVEDAGGVTGILYLDRGEKAA